MLPSSHDLIIPHLKRIKEYKVVRGLVCRHLVHVCGLVSAKGGLPCNKMPIDARSSFLVKNREEMMPPDAYVWRCLYACGKPLLLSPRDEGHATDHLPSPRLLKRAGHWQDWETDKWYSST
jgi:hypothetical protein